MKKVVLTLNDVIYEKLRFEAIIKKKSVTEIIKYRLLAEPFEKEVEEAYDNYILTIFGKTFEDKNESC